MPGDIMPPTAYCQRQVQPAGQLNPCDNILCARTARDQRRVAIDHAIPHGTLLINQPIA
jgi:hypothetical protein